MPRISAIKTSINRATNIRPGRGISRVYHNLTNYSRIEAGFAGLEFLFAMTAAKNQNIFNTLLFGGLTMYFTKKAVQAHNLMIKLYDHYQAIVERAEQIAKFKNSQGSK